MWHLVITKYQYKCFYWDLDLLFDSLNCGTVGSQSLIPLIVHAVRVSYCKPAKPKELVDFCGSPGVTM